MAEIEEGKVSSIVAEFEKNWKKAKLQKEKIEPDPVIVEDLADLFRGLKESLELLKRKKNDHSRFVQFFMGLT